MSRKLLRALDLDRPWISMPTPHLKILLLTILLVAVPAVAKDLDDTSELFNPLLGVAYSHWLTGPAGQIASEAEIAEYLDLLDDDEASRFIDDFWSRRAEGTKPFQKTPRELFDLRAVEADKRFSEGAVPGRLSDRGTIFVLFGEPARITFETQRRAELPALETWWYEDEDEAEDGLHGESPRSRYQFLRDDSGEVVLFTGQRLRKQELRRRLNSRPRF